MVKEIKIIGLENFPDVKPGDDLGKLIVEIAKLNGIEIEDGDIIVVSSKIVSKAEGRIINLQEINPSEEALRLSELTNLDPKLIELILKEGEVLKIKPDLIITFVRNRIVCGNSGIDFSNVNGSGINITLLPEDPDKSAKLIRKRIEEITGKKIAVLIVDTCGRPFRKGVVNFVIGLSGINPFRSYVGKKDKYGYTMLRTIVCIVDEIAAATELVIGQGNEGIPVAIVKGVKYEPCEECTAQDITMPKEQWLFK